LELRRHAWCAVRLELGVGLPDDLVEVGRVAVCVCGYGGGDGRKCEHCSDRCFPHDLPFSAASFGDTLLLPIAEP
jgi:hypothetical protein